MESIERLKKNHIRTYPGHLTITQWAVCIRKTAFEARFKDPDITNKDAILVAVKKIFGVK